MKVCILSMQQVKNYGSVLQAYSLKKIIEELGHQVSFIDIKKGDNIELNMQCFSLAPRDDTINVNCLTKQIQRVKSKICGRKISKLFEQFRSEELGIKIINEYNQYDACVIGSDEVFNCLQKSKWGFDSQLFGNVQVSDRVITYAASCGATKAEMLSKELKTAIVKAMGNLNAISVRDENTACFVRSMTEQEYIYNLDPVAVGDFTKEIKNVDISIKLPKSYCIVYSYKNRISDLVEINAISNYCKKNGLEIIAPFGKQNWIRKYRELTPFELLKAFENAECIITDTFHGTLFGAKFAKKIAIIIRNSNRNKLEDLTKRLNIEKHVLTNIDNLEEVLSLPLDKIKIESVLKIEREKTDDYLKNSL